MMLCSHCPINDSSGCLHITVYIALMLQASWRTQRVTKSQKVHISSHDVLQKSHTQEEGGALLRISFWHLLINFEKPKKSEKNIAGDIISIYTCVLKTTIRQSLRYRVTQFFFVIQGLFFLFTPSHPLPPTQHPRKPKF